MIDTHASPGDAPDTHIGPGDALDTHAGPGDALDARARIDDDDRERGDVPGWVLVTLMTAGLVLTLWAVAGPALVEVFQSAIDRVTSFGG